MVETAITVADIVTARDELRMKPITSTELRVLGHAGIFQGRVFRALEEREQLLIIKEEVEDMVCELRERLTSDLQTLERILEMVNIEEEEGGINN